MPELVRIRLYPFKALDPVDVAVCDILPSGALKHDRAFALVDADGIFLNGKRIPAVHGLRASFNPDLSVISLHAPQRADLGSISARLDATTFANLEAWLDEYFEFPVRVQRDATRGFPDDTDAPGPTLISTVTLETVASWFTGLSLESVRLRFRANLEIGGVPAFWEDRLFGAVKGSDVPFGIGTAKFFGTNPCQRCIVPTRDALSGEQWPAFQKVFMERRKSSLPEWAAAERFNHFYRLALNTRAEAGTVRVGDRLELS